MAQPKIVAYLKPVCGWSNGVRAILKKYNLEYEDRDIINDPRQYHEMVTKSRQPLSPCVEVGGVMLADVSGDEVEAYLLEQNLAAPSAVKPEVPTNEACADHGAPVNTPSMFRR